MTIPGLSVRPGFYDVNIDFDENGGKARKLLLDFSKHIHTAYLLVHTVCDDVMTRSNILL
jgi:hypothetical protein